MWIWSLKSSNVAMLWRKLVSRGKGFSYDNTETTKACRQRGKGGQTLYKQAPDISVEKIADDIGVDPRTIYRDLKGAGIQLPPQKPPIRRIDPAKIRQAHELYKQLGTKAKVAAAMNCAPSMVAIYLNRDIETP